MNKSLLILLLILVGGYVAYATYGSYVTQDTHVPTLGMDEKADTEEVVVQESDPNTSNDVTPPVVIVTEQDPEVTPEVVPEERDVVDRQALARTLTTQEACEREGGSWVQSFSLTRYCKLPTTDIGVPCTDNSQCESWCQAPKGTLSGTKVTGACFGYTSSACSQDIVDGIAEAEACQ